MGAQKANFTAEGKGFQLTIPRLYGSWGEVEAIDVGG